MDDVIVDAERKQVSRASLIPESATTDAGRTEKKMIEDAAEPKLPRKRVMCPRCARPSPSACICAALPGQKIQLRRSQCLILQHPHETKLKNRSLPLVELCVDPRNITVTIGRRFGLDSAVMKQMERRTNQPVWLLSPEEGAIPLTQAIEERENKERDVLVIVLDATWKFAREMDKACIQNNCYPKHMLRVQLSELDFDCFKPRRFDIRTPPTDQHLSTAECLAFVLSRIEEDNKHTIIYDTIMRPLDLMVQQWHSFSDRTAADRKQKRQITTSQNGGAAENHRNKRSRTLIDTPEM